MNVTKRGVNPGEECKLDILKKKVLNETIEYDDITRHNLSYWNLTWFNETRVAVNNRINEIYNSKYHWRKKYKCVIRIITKVVNVLQ